MNKRPQTFHHLDKVFWPKEGYTKGDVIRYYGRIALRILPYLEGRPNSLNRFPNGITGIHFFQKNVAKASMPAYVQTRTIRAKTNGKNVRYVLCDNQETLLYLANLGCIEVHPWSSRVGTLLKPDYLILDLDPGTRATFRDVIAVARATHALLDAAGMPNVCKTSGKRGLHIFVPLGAKYSFERVRQCANLVAQAVHKKIPELTSLEHWPAKRKNKVRIDTMRNAIGQTVAAPYSLRPTPSATVSAPLRWKEVKAGLRPERFTIETIFKRLQSIGDPWKPVMGRAADLAKATRYLARIIDSPAE